MGAHDAQKKTHPWMSRSRCRCTSRHCRSTCRLASTLRAFRRNSCFAGMRRLHADQGRNGRCPNAPSRARVVPTGADRNGSLHKCHLRWAGSAQQSAGWESRRRDGGGVRLTLTEASPIRPQSASALQLGTCVLMVFSTSGLPPKENRKYFLFSTFLFRKIIAKSNFHNAKERFPQRIASSSAVLSNSIAR
jgi:hypothetical protein